MQIFFFFNRSSSKWTFSVKIAGRICQPADYAVFFQREENLDLSRPRSFSIRLALSIQQSQHQVRRFLWQPSRGYTNRYRRAVRLYNWTNSVTLFGEDPAASYFTVEKYAKNKWNSWHSWNYQRVKSRGGVFYRKTAAGVGVKTQLCVQSQTKWLSFEASVFWWAARLQLHTDCSSFSKYWGICTTESRPIVLFSISKWWKWVREKEACAETMQLLYGQLLNQTNTKSVHECFEHTHTQQQQNGRINWSLYCSRLEIMHILISSNYFHIFLLVINLIQPVSHCIVCCFTFMKGLWDIIDSWLSPNLYFCWRAWEVLVYKSNNQSADLMSWLPVSGRRRANVDAPISVDQSTSVVSFQCAESLGDNQALRVHSLGLKLN